MLAGNVSADIDTDGFSERHLRIFGDASTNGISVTQVAPGTFYVVGMNRSGPTQVNGSFGVSFFYGVTGQVSVSLGAGNDHVRIGGFDATTRDTLPSDLIVNGGDGNDTVVVEWLSFSSSTSALQIITHTGNDTVTVSDVSSPRSMYISTGDGADAVAIRATGVRTDLSADTGTGNDSFTAASVSAGTLSVQMGSGNDVVAVIASSFNDAYVNGDRGSDRLNRKGNTRAIRVSSVERLTAK